MQCYLFWVLNLFFTPADQYVRQNVQVNNVIPEFSGAWLKLLSLLLHVIEDITLEISKTIAIVPNHSFESTRFPRRESMWITHGSLTMNNSIREKITIRRKRIMRFIKPGTALQHSIHEGVQSFIIFSIILHSNCF